MKGFDYAYTTVCARTEHSSIWSGDRAKILIRDKARQDSYDVVTVRIDSDGYIQIFYSPELSGRLSCKPGTDDELS